MYYYWYHSPVGKYYIEASQQGITQIAKENNSKYTIVAKGQELDSHPRIKDAIVWLDAYFAGQNPTWELKICPQGTDFQRLVWQILQEIPYGQSTSYGQIASQVAKKMGRSSMSSQAVGNAVGRNPISIYTPCHRVLGKAGALTGYADGIDTKIYLLELENIPYKS